MDLRRFGLSLCICAALAAPTAALAPDEFQDAFQRGVEALRAGDDTAALRAFQEALALDPSHELAYELWKSTDHAVWLQLLSRGGELELSGRRLMELASLGRAERKPDPEAIKELLGRVYSQDVLERRKALAQLAAQHGSYAVPYMLPALADAADDDKRVLAIGALTDMGDDVVPPLVAALSSPDAYLRRNVALTLGYIGDRRAAPVLALHAAGDADQSARAAAAEALARCGGGKDALALLLEHGNAYRRLDPSVLRPYQIGEAIWEFQGDRLGYRSVPRALYAEELAAECFRRAIDLQPASVPAQAGLATALAAELQHIDAWRSSGVDVAALEPHAAALQLELAGLGEEAHNLGLLESLRAGDAAASMGLCRALGVSGTKIAQGLGLALENKAGPLRSEAALACAHIASRTRSQLSPRATAGLGEAVGRQASRLVGVVDVRPKRMEALTAALESAGIAVHGWSNGAQALGALRRVPGLDALIVADELNDITLAQIVSEVRADERLASMPIVVLTADAEGAQSLWGERIQGVLTGTEDVGAIDLAAVEAAMSERMGADREQALAIAARAAQALAQVARAGADLGPARAGLAAALDGRPDEVAAPALEALALGGTAAELAAVAGALEDGSRSEAVRVLAARALAGIASRHADAGPKVRPGLLAIVRDGNAPADLRLACAQALGAAGGTPEERAEALRALRGLSAREAVPAE